MTGRTANRTKYRAVIIDGRRIARGAAVTAAAVIIISIIICCIRGGSAEKAESGASAGKAAELFKATAVYLLGFDPWSPQGAAASEIRGADTVNSYGIISGRSVPPVVTEAPRPTDAPAVAENTGSIKEINAAQNARYENYQIRLGNQTSYTPDINQLLSEKLSLEMGGGGPKVLIVHTHATEAYAAEGAQAYNRDESDRSLDTAENVVAVGDMLADYFNSRGIETIHDRALHDHPSFNGSYADALESTESYLNEYPGIQIVFDLHRDSVVYDDGTMAKVVTEINGKKAAQLMFVVGTNEKGLYHPEWRENLKFAVQLQNRIDERYPTLMRYVNLRQERFNGHTTRGSVIIEVGTSGNSLEEAKYGMSCAAECIADFLLGLI